MVIEYEGRTFNSTLVRVFLCPFSLGPFLQLGQTLGKILEKMALQLTIPRDL